MFKKAPLFSHLAKALNAEQRDELCLAVCSELPQDGSVPEWVQLIPPGRDIAGFDGRHWLNDKPEAVLAYFANRQARGRDLVFDYEHSTEHKAPLGEEAPASAWGKQMEIRDGGSVWVRPEWTERAANAIANKEYRYLSPVLIYERTTGRIVGIDSVGLTNKANLSLKALNREQPGQHQHHHEETPMDLIKALCQALSIDTGSSETQVLAAVNQLKEDHGKALNQAQNPSLEKFVPRAEHDAAVARANNSEQALKDHKDAQLETEIDNAISAAQDAGKIAPASVDFYKANCREEGGLERFNKFIESAPVITEPSGLKDKDPEKDKGKALNAEEQAIANVFGNTAEDLAKYAG